MGNLTEALAVTVVGIAVVFAVLVILMGVLSLMKLFAPKQKAAEEVKPEAPAPAKSDEGELVAVLAAAVAAMGNARPGYQLNIKSYKRVSDGASAWTKAK